jgi:hypothetical protein
MSARLASLCLVLVAGCSDPDPGGNQDMSVPDGALGDGSMFDLSLSSACLPTDPMTDFTACPMTGACPAGQVAVNVGAGDCRCLYSCDPQNPKQCPCTRRCVTLVAGDAGVVGGGCFPANGPAERCGVDNMGMLFGRGTCAQTLTCAGPASGAAYCLYDCLVQSDCPAQTTCAPIRNQQGMQIGLACQFNSGAAGKPAGAACSATDACITGHVCDTTCKPQCDGPSATCASGTCQKLVDGTNNKTIAWVCK